MPNSSGHWRWAIFITLFLLPAPAVEANPIKFCVSLLRMATFPQWRALHRAARLIEEELKVDAMHWDSALFEDRQFAERSLRVLIAALNRCTENLRPHERLAFYESLREDDSPVGYLSPFLEDVLNKTNKLGRINAALHFYAREQIELNTPERE